MGERLFKFKKLRDVNTPTRSYEDAAGWDFYIPNNWQKFDGSPEELKWESCIIGPGQGLLIPSGLQMRLHSNIALRFDNKSGKAVKGLIVGATIVDSDYQGEIHLNVWNVSKSDIAVKRGEKLLQGIFFEVPKIILLETTQQLFTEISARGGSGFGSSDKNN